jgi:hypothetical protein
VRAREPVQRASCQQAGTLPAVFLSLLVGVRTEEARALRRDHVDLEGDPDADPPVPPHIDAAAAPGQRTVPPTACGSLAARSTALLMSTPFVLAPAAQDCAGQIRTARTVAPRSVRHR